MPKHSTTVAESAVVVAVCASLGLAAVNADVSLRGHQRALAPSAKRSALPRAYGLVSSHIFAQRPSRAITLEIGQRDIRIRRSFQELEQATAESDPNRTRPRRGIRKRVTEFSDGSKRRLMFTARNFSGLEIMLTLTYPSEFPMNGRLVK